MEFMNFPGTGNSKVYTNSDILIELNNIPITKEKIDIFFKILKINDISVKMSNRKTVRRWGTANFQTRQITLYRHSVMVFIHELAHIFTRASMKNGRWDYHGYEFGRTVDYFIIIWQKEMNQKISN